MIYFSNKKLNTPKSINKYIKIARISMYLPNSPWDTYIYVFIYSLVDKDQLLPAMGQTRQRSRMQKAGKIFRDAWNSHLNG